MMKNINVSVPVSPKDYTISFYNDFEQQKLALKSQVGDRKFIIVSDQNVVDKTSFLDLFVDADDEVLVVLEPGEQEKKWDSIDRILRGAFEAGLDRDSVIVAVGGGVVGDMTGFAASIFMRGIPFIQVPTTLLAMVDASIGGKTGIDCEYGKNLIGSITPPEAILVCPEFLETLPDVEVKNGIAEMVKHGIIASPQHFEALETLASENFETIKSKIFDYVIASIEVKKVIVEQDEHERGVRGFLNLGHTFGHAIELCSHFEIPHGRAVAIGCVMAANYAAEQELCDWDLVDRIENIFNQFEIDLSCDIPEEDIWKAMQHDKKKQDGKVRLILPQKIGVVDYFEIIPQ